MTLMSADTLRGIVYFLDKGCTKPYSDNLFGIQCIEEDAVFVKITTVSGSLR